MIKGETLTVYINFLWFYQLFMYLGLFRYLLVFQDKNMLNKGFVKGYDVKKMRLVQYMLVLDFLLVQGVY